MSDKFFGKENGDPWEENLITEDKDNILNVCKSTSIQRTKLGSKNHKNFKLDPETSSIDEKEKLYVELKHILARQPGPEAAEQLQLYRHTLREKTKQLKVLSSELNMYESQSHEYKYEIERLANELLNVKKKYLAQKRKEQNQKNKECISMIENTYPTTRPGPRYTGGGFSISKTTKAVA